MIAGDFGEIIGGFHPGVWGLEKFPDLTEEEKKRIEELQKINPPIELPSLNGLWKDYFLKKLEKND